LHDPARDEITARVDRIEKPAWPFRPHPVFDARPMYLSRAARPFLPDLFPGFDVYVWIDADAWVQQPLALKWLIEAAAISDFAGVPTVHRAYTFKDQDMGWIFERYRRAFGEGVSRELMARPYFNSGVMAMRAGSPLWRRYVERFQTALDTWEGDFLSDQAVVNAVAYLDGGAVQRLPARANWLCHLARPLLHEESGRLLEPAFPFESILIVHNTFDDKTRAIELQTEKGQPRRTRLTHSAIKSLR
jgi:lipopolysaccharide biosynthesis glycosyltransferase